MSLIQKIFSKKIVVDKEKEKDQSLWSFEFSQVDKLLMAEVLKNEIEASAYLAFLDRSIQLKADKLVLLKDEIQHLETYIGFFKRANATSFHFKFEQKGDSDQLQIFPFMVFPLVMNAFYLGYNSMDRFPVRIRLNLQRNVLKLEVSNRVNHHVSDQENNDSIRWFKSRLRTFYPDQHQLFFNSNSNLFKATLLLELSV